MFDIADIVFHKEYGLGIIKKIENITASIIFCNEKTYKILIDHPSLKEVNKELIDRVIKSNIHDYFDDWTIKKAEDYGQLVSICDSDERGISANVKGSKDYLTTIKINNRSLMFSCTCPVGGVCKHEAALYDVLKNKFIKLSGMVTNKSFEKELSQCINYVKDNNSSFSTKLRICDILLEHLSVDILIKTMTELEPEPYSYSYSYSYSYYRRNNKKQIKELIDYLMLIDEIRNIIYDNLLKFQSLQNFKIIIKAIEDANNIKYSQDSNKLLEYYFANRKYKECIIESFYHCDYSNRTYILEACDRVKIDDELIKAIKTMTGITTNFSLYRTLIMKLSFDDVLDLAENNEYEFIYSDIRKYTKEQKIKLLPYTILDEDDIFSILDSDLSNDIDDKAKAKMISKIDKYDLSGDEKTKLITHIKKLKDSKYLLEYFEKNEYGHNYYWYGSEQYSLKKNEVFDIDDDVFFTYFVEDYKVKRNNDVVLLYCYLKTLDDKTIIEAVVLDNEYRITSNNYDGRNGSVYIRYLIDYINKKHAEDITEKRTKYLLEIKQEKDIEKSNNALKCLNRISSEETNIIKLIDNKAHLEYYFDFDEEGRNTLSLRVGINKVYVVKNVFQFFESFSKCNSVEYGKNFVLTHDLDNFIEKDAKIIKELLKTRIYSENKKDLIITSDMVDYLFEELKNQTIYFKKKPYNLRLDNKELNFFVDNEYRIQLTNNLNYDSYLFSNKNIYLLEDEEKCIDCMYSNQKDTRIINFLLQNINTNIKPLLNEFKEVVYYDYRDILTIDESIKDDFYMADINIKAYFDYEDSIVKCRSEYYIDNKVVEIENVKEKYNITKLNKYHNYLKNLGFDNDILENDGKILNFFYMDFSELKKYCEVYLSESIQNKKVSYFAPTKIQIQYQSNIMQAFVKESEYSDEELYKILAAIKKKKKFIVMQDDRIIDLTNKDAKEFADTVEELDLNKKKLTESTSLPIAKALKAIAHQNSCNIDDYLLNMINDISNFKNANIKLPNINTTLRDYQKEGFNWLSILSKYNIGGILADDMGLGKTIETIALIMSDNSKCPNLIVCPKSVVFNWVNEFKKFASNEKIIEIYGSKKQRENIIQSIKQKEKTTYVVSYDSLRNDIEMYKTVFNYIVLDEAQYIKNVNAQKTNNVKKLKGTHRLALTGTPIENNIVDLWSVFDFVIPGYFENIDEFKSRYNNDENYTHIISRRVAPFILRRNKKDVLKDLPEKYEHILSAEMSVPQRKVYDAYVLKAKEKMDEGLGAFDILPYLMRLRQICIDPKIFIENYEGDSGKMTMLRQIIVDYINNDHRMMIVSQFVQALNQIEEMLKELNISYFIITGSVDAKKRMEICDKFNNGSKEKIVLVSLKAGGTGINLIGADTVIHLDPWWNVAATNQATDRTYRIGQQRNVEVIKLICEDSIEQRVIELQNIKKDLIEKVISDNDSSVTNASIEDIRFILN